MDVLAFDPQGQLPGESGSVADVHGPQQRSDVARGPVLHLAGHGDAAAGSLRHPGGQRLPRLPLRGLPQQQRRTSGSTRFHNTRRGPLLILV